ncbi:hypothetical protein JHD49_04615 [Sulfurimonas sp. SAG-AH-194-C21]|nr:hypothetical protein [Sulfurimonas sp. SAG-AH-194-C21]MDF1883215.1 hypothetical protein [Sulfurimonas sp. SAG-AH-194-C21]
MYITKLILFTLLIHSSLFAWENYGGDYFFDLDVNKNFSELENKNVYGDFVATGDSILFIDDGSTPNLITSHTSYKMDMNITQFSSAADPRKRNSSTSVLNLPSYVQGSDIVWAGLFWQGHINETGTPLTNDAVDDNVSGYDTVSIVSEDGTIYETINSKTYHTASRDADDFRYFYGAYADITNFVSANYSSVNNEFTVGNIMTTAGLDVGSPLYINNSQTDPKLFLDDTAQFGYYGGWSLIVIYNITNTQTVTDNDVKLKNVTIFDGYDLFLTWGEDNVEFIEDVTVDGFYTPIDGNISSKLLIFGGAGDKNLTPDILQFLDTSSTFIDLSNTPNTAGNQFNHTYTNLGLDMDTNSTTATNKQGMDLDIYDISDYMSNGQSSATIRFGTEKTGAGFSGSSDQFFPQVIGFSTELFQPTFCYDYAYQQSGKYFTEDFNQTTSPSLVGSNILTGTTYPIGMSIFIRNTVNSDINVTDLNVSITDLDASQVTYISGTTAIARNSSLNKTSLAGVGLTDIPIGTVTSNEYIYVYYDLDAAESNLSTPIKVTLDYVVTINNTPITYSSQIPSTDIPICPQGSSSYNPTSGIFNIVHNNYYDLDIVGGTNAYYNLPTQVTKREGNFKVLSLEDDGDFNTLSPRNTIVAIDMIDVSAFQSTFASCNELTTSITDDKVWITFDGNNSIPFDQAALQNAIADGMTSLSTSSQFYKTARRNVAYRVTYNIGNDTNQSIINTSLDVTGYTITNAGNFSFSDATCNGSGLSKTQLKVCADDIYGDNTKAVCSRDNFSIRPEAFLIKFNDQNQTNPALKTRLSDQVSGLASPDDNITHLAADYEYNIEATATDHLGNTNSYGYTKQFDSYTTDKLLYIWEPRNDRNTSGCSNISDKITYVRFTNGAFDGNTSVSEIGDYRLNITDTFWTVVDNDIEYMKHHLAPYFKIDPVTLEANTDCTLNTGITQSINSPSLNGCNISSSHVNSDANLTYNDYNVTMHPYKFDLNISLTVGPQGVGPTSTSYIYMSDISRDENMSVHLNGRIKAVGYKDSSVELTNFVAQCYSEPLEIRVTKSNLTLPIAYQYRFNSLDNNITEGDLNTSASVINLLGSDFLNGNSDTILNLNFSRVPNNPQNPQEITFTRYDVNCSVLTDCTFNADLLNNKITAGSKDFNATIKHYYGRTHSPRQRFSTPQGTVALPANELIYYEVYCSGGTCDKTLLQNSLDSNSTDDPRWFVNTNHTSTYGTINFITQKGTRSDISLSSIATGNHPDSVGLVYDASRGYPYKATMEVNASSWLIYNKYNAGAALNEFEVEFLDSNTSWAGNRETNTTTNKTASDKTNRRTMW